MMKIVEQLRTKNVAPSNGYWQWAVQKLWMVEEPEEGHGSCNRQRPGSKDYTEIVTALTLLRYFVQGTRASGPRKNLQDILLRSTHAPHEKLPKRLHNARAVSRIIELLDHEEADVRHAAACVLAAGCCGAHRGFQDAISVSLIAIHLLLELLKDDDTVQAAALALGRACEHGHKVNQDLICKTKTGAAQLLDLIEHEDDAIAKTVQYAIFWANVNAHSFTKTHWDRSRGLCISLSKPREPCQLWDAAFCRKHHLEMLKDNSKADHPEGRLAIQVANNQTIEKTGRVCIGEQFLQMIKGTPEEKKGRKESKMRKASKRHHTELGHQAPNHAHQRLSTKHDKLAGHHHLHGDIFDEHSSSRPSSVDHSRTSTKRTSSRMSCILPRPSSTPTLSLADGTADALSGTGSRPSTAKDGLLGSVSLPLLPSLTGQILTTVMSPTARSKTSAMGDSDEGSEASDYDLHHVDPALDDQNVCRIGQEVRHCSQTGFLKPMSVNKRYGMCT
jgi:hypothetical protein